MPQTFGLARSAAGGHPFEYLHGQKLIFGIFPRSEGAKSDAVKPAEVSLGLSSSITCAIHYFTLKKLVHSLLKCGVCRCTSISGRGDLDRRYRGLRVPRRQHVGFADRSQQVTPCACAAASGDDTDHGIYLSLRPKSE